MKEKVSCNCVFCGTPTADSNFKEVLNVHRWRKGPKQIAKREKTSIDLPICATCHSKLHPYPYMKVVSYLSLFMGIIIVACILFSYIQRDLFSIYSLGGIFISLLFCVGGAIFITWGGIFTTFTLYDSAFNATINIAPYKDLEVVKYLKENGFVDENDENYIVLNTEDIEYVPFLTFRDTLKEKYGLR